MFETYPRLFGKEKRVIYSRHQLDELVKLYNGKKNIIVSLYGFAETDSKGVIKESAIIDCLCYLCIGDEALKWVRDTFDRPLKVIRTAEKCFYALDLTSLPEGENLMKWAEAVSATAYLKGLSAPIVAPNVLLDLMVPYPGTIRMKTGEVIVMEDV